MSVIDTHTHFFPQEWVKLLEQEAPDHGATIGRNAQGAVTFEFPGMHGLYMGTHINRMNLDDKSFFPAFR